MNKIEKSLIQSSDSHVGYTITLNKQINRYFVLAGKMCTESKSDICLIEFYKYN